MAGDVFTVRATGETVQGRRGAVDVFALKRNGVTVATGTYREMTAERDARIRTGINPLAGIAGELRRR